MSQATARKVVDSIFSSPSPFIKIEFQGGEPTLNWDVLKWIVEYAERLNHRKGKQLEFVLCTNLIHLDENMANFLAWHKVMISTSLDGPPDLHDLHRISAKGSSSYKAFQDNLKLVRRVMGQHSCSPLATITSSNLNKLKNVIDEYINFGFSGIFLRPVNPYGRAKEQWANLSFPMEKYVRVYQEALQYIIEINLNGTFFVEYYAALMLARILTPFSTGFVDVQSPSGAGISGVIYDTDGSVYPTDEARMLARVGDKRFKLGNVLTDSYKDIFLGSTLRELINVSCVETLPGCTSCAYNLYCGADPVRNYVECGDVVGHRPTSEFCMRNTGILDYIFELLEKDDNDIIDVFWSWLTNRSLEELRV
jgi:His-Xaa-Ser system radical SAM maturase HxsB